MPLAGRTVPIAATHIYQMSFFTGFGVSMVVYCALNYFFPSAGTYREFEEVDVSAEEETDKEPYMDRKNSFDKDQAVSVKESVVESSV